MCGIAGIHFKDPGNTGFTKTMLDRYVDQLLLGIEHRGQDATGIVAVTDGGKQVLLKKADKDATEFIKIRPQLGDMERVRTVLLHTRFATQGHQSNNSNNHPVLYKTCFATHNGHINNDDALFREFDLRRHAEVDSEIIPALFSEFGLDKAHKALQELEGNLAVAVIDPVQFPDKLILAKGNSSPLIFFENSRFITWASTLQTLVDAWGLTLGTPPKAKRFWELQEGGLLLIEGAESELLQFKVKEYTRYAPGWSGSTYAYSAPKNRNSGDCKNCGCSAFWHGKEDWSGACSNKPAQLGGYLCNCIQFVRNTDVLPDDLIECFSCNESKPAYMMDEIWTDNFMCDSCLYDKHSLVDDQGCRASRECRHSDCGLTCGDSLPEVFVPGTQLALVSARECTHSTCGSSCGFPDTILGVSVGEAETEPVELGIWIPSEGPWSNEDRHTAILNALAAETAFHIKFIEWILFKAPLDITAGDPFLEEARELLDELYADKEDEFNALEASVAVERPLVLQ